MPAGILPPMSGIFISSAQADRPRVAVFVKALGLQGWSVWKDRTIQPSKTWDQVIETELAQAKCAIVRARVAG